MNARITASRKNAFRDLGFSADEAEHIRVRSDLMIGVQKTIAARRLTQAEVADLLGVTQPRVSDLVRGRLDLFSIETLIDMLAHFGIRVKLVLQAPRKRAGVA